MDIRDAQTRDVKTGLEGRQRRGGGAGTNAPAKLHTQFHTQGTYGLRNH